MVSKPTKTLSGPARITAAALSPNLYTKTDQPIEMLRESAVEPMEERYSRQVLYPGIGVDGQRQLTQGHVAVVGCGATGAAAAALLARAGVGTLSLDRPRHC